MCANNKRLVNFNKVDFLIKISTHLKIINKIAAISNYNKYFNIIENK